MPEPIDFTRPLEPLLTVECDTYMGDVNYDMPHCPEYLDDGKENLIHVYDDMGLRLCLGGPFEDEDRPDICVEKFHEGWRVFIHPANADPDYVIELRPKSTRVEDAGGKLIHETEHDWR